jgi:lipoate-protein ligase A
LEKYQPKVVRRLSGGGAVYHDLGNLNFSFIYQKNKLQSYESFVEPIIDALNQLGVPAVFSGKNDLLVENKKISGNAQCV